MSRRPESPISFTISLGVLIFFVFAFKQSILDANNIPSGSMIPTLKIGDYLFVNKMRYSMRLPFAEFLGFDPIEVSHIDDPKRGDVITFIPPAESGKHYVKRVMGMPGDRIRIRNVPACQLPRFTGKADPTIQRAFRCSPAGDRNEPLVAFVEYKERDQGDWKNYSPVEIPNARARELLLDSDNINVLPPDLVPENVFSKLPVLFQETFPGGTHLIVETSLEAPTESMCDEVATTGCMIPEGRYLVMGDNRDDSKDSRFRTVGYISRDVILGKVVIIYFSINWKDEICEGYAATFLRPEGVPGPQEGFKIPGFPPEKQARWCSRQDEGYQAESWLSYLTRTVLYRIPRLDVRWSRIGSFLK